MVRCGKEVYLRRSHQGETWIRWQGWLMDFSQGSRTHWTFWSMYVSVIVLCCRKLENTDLKTAYSLFFVIVGSSLIHRVYLLYQRRALLLFKGLYAWAVNKSQSRPAIIWTETFFLPLWPTCLLRCTVLLIFTEALGEPSVLQTATDRITGLSSQCSLWECGGARSEPQDQACPLTRSPRSQSSWYSWCCSPPTGGCRSGSPLFQVCTTCSGLWIPPQYSDTVYMKRSL